MAATGVLNVSELDELRTVVARIALISHASTSRYDAERGGGSGNDIGGNRPPGGDDDSPMWPGDKASAKQIADYREDYQAWLGCYQRKTPAWFAAQLGDDPSERRITELLADARSVLEAWQRTPIPAGQEPEISSPQWKRFVAESSLDNGTLARRFGVTRQYIHHIRRSYGTAT